MALQTSLVQTFCLSEQFARLPVELLIEIASYLGQLTEHHGMSDGPRSAQASAFLMALMAQSSHLRRAARPLFWSEVHVSSKSRVSDGTFTATAHLQTSMTEQPPLAQWKKLHLLLKGNRFKKSPPILDARLIETLDLSLDQPSEAAGGVDEEDLTQMAQILGELQHLRVRVGKDVSMIKLCGTKNYLGHLKSLGRPLAPPDSPSNISRLSIYSPMPQSTHDCLLLAAQFTQLQTLVLDNIKPPQSPFVPPNLPNLQYFIIRNASNVKFDLFNGFGFLVGCKELLSLSLQGLELDSDFLMQVLTTHKDNLSTLEIGTPVQETCLSRWDLAEAREAGLRSLDTGWYIPMDMLENSTRIGDEAAELCTSVTHLSLGGLMCVSPELLRILNDSDREPLDTLRLHDAGPQRPTRPGSDRDAAREQALIQTHPAGIAPQDMLDALEDGFKVRTLDIRGMGHEWDFRSQELAVKVKERCIELGIALIC